MPLIPLKPEKPCEDLLRSQYRGTKLGPLGGMMQGERVGSVTPIVTEALAGNYVTPDESPEHVSVANQYRRKAYPKIKGQFRGNRLTKF